MTTSGRERRRAPRALADFPIQLSPGKTAAGQSTAPARLKDLSAIGLCCTTSTELVEFTKLGIDLQLPGQSRRHTLQGAVVRSEPSRTQKGMFEVAVYFTQIEPATKVAIGAFVEAAEPA